MFSNEYRLVSHKSVPFIDSRYKSKYQTKSAKSNFRDLRGEVWEHSALETLLQTYDAEIFSAIFLKMSSL